MIAAVALVHKLTLVTHNTADYQNVSGLRLDDWLTMNGETMIERCVIDQLDPLRVGKAQCPH